MATVDSIAQEVEDDHDGGQNTKFLLGGKVLQEAELHSVELL